MKSSIYIYFFALVAWTFGVISRKPLPTPRFVKISTYSCEYASLSLYYYLLLYSFPYEQLQTCFCPTLYVVFPKSYSFRTVISLEVTFVCDVKGGLPSFIACGYLVIPEQFTENYSSLH